MKSKTHTDILNSGSTSEQAVSRENTQYKYKQSNRAQRALILMDFPESDEKLIRLLLPRLERISVDSYWAHRASGVRGALTKVLEQMETGEAVDPLSLKKNLSAGFDILKEAAEEYT